MDRQSVSTSLSPEVIIGQVMGDLSIKGWSEATVFVQADPSELVMDQQDDTIHLACQGDCAIRLPHGANIKVEAIHGDAQLKYLEDELVLGEIHGSLTLRAVGPTQIDTVYGDFYAKEIDGSLQVGSIFGNAVARDIQGDCLLAEVQGNLDLRTILGRVKASSNGNVRMSLESLTADAYQISTEGNLHGSLPPDASLKLDLRSEAEIIKVKLPDSSQVYRQPQITLNLGTGEASMELSAGGGVYLACDIEQRHDARDGSQEGTEDWPDDLLQQVARQVEAQVSSQVEQMTQQLNEQMERMSKQFSQVGMTPEQVEKILEQTRQVRERETARAQEKVRRAQEKLERKLDATRRRQDAKAQSGDPRSQARSRRSWGVDWPPAPPIPPSPPGAPVPSQAEGVSEEERLMILRMLEQKKISLEEADKLLSALEGKE